MALLESLLLLAFICNEPSQAVDDNFRTTSFPFPFYFRSGQEIVLTCWIPDGYAFRHWAHPANEFVSSTNGRYLIEMRPGHVTLKVTNTMSTDGGSYTCHAYRGAAPRQSSISVYHADPIIIYSASVNVTVNVGESYNFSCNATNVLYRQWLYVVPSQRPRVMSNSTDGRVIVTSNFELQLRDIRFEDDGTYQCMLTNNLGRLGLTNNLSVIARPEVFVASSFKEVMENSSATLTCTVTGVPLPTITWRDRSGQIIANADGVSVTSSMVNSSVVVGSLTFSKVGSSQTGPYTCWGVNKYDNSSATINLRLHDTPEPPQNVMLVLVNHTNVRVSWTAPQSSVDTYVIMYRVLNGTSSARFMSRTVASSSGTTAVLTGLDRLTLYSVLVYATNTHGASPNSNEETIATTATVPGQPSEVVVLDVGSSLLRVEWPSLSLPWDDGGAQLQRVRITALVVQGGRLIPTVNKTVDVEDGFAILQGLEDTTSYQIRVEFANRIGYGPGLLSSTFQTPLPGAPGSPIHVLAREVSGSSVLLCWQDSASGQPFLKYKFEVEESGEDVHLTFGRNADEIESYPDILGCSKGLQVTGLNSESCYRFRVTAINNVGNGQPSSPSEEVCTQKSSCVGADCSQPKCEEGKNCSLGLSNQGLPATTVVIVAVVPTVVTAAIITFLVTLLCCSSARRAKMRKLEKSGECIPGINRRESANSSTKLLSIGRNLSDSFSSSSSNYSPEAQLEQPGTATTLISNVFEEDFTKSNEAQFVSHDSSPKAVSVPHGTAPHTQPIFYTSDGRQGVLQLPQGKYEDHGFAASSNIYPIMEDPPSYTNCMNPVGPSNPSAFGHAHTTHENKERMVMTDNPNYDDKVQPFMTRGQSSSELEHSGSSSPPPIPPYYGGSMTDVQSEAITNRFVHIPTPSFGESYSQAGYSPDQDRRGDPRQNLHMKTNVSYDRNAYPQEDAIAATGEVNFVDNGAYETFTAVRGPKFEIKGGEERGAIRETVEIRKH